MRRHHYIALLWIMGLTGICGLRVTASAQTIPPEFRQYDNYDRYQYLPRLPQGPENPNPFPTQTQPATGDPRVLVDELKALIFVDDPSKVSENAGQRTGVLVDADNGYSLMHSTAFYEIANRYLGQPISLLRLNELIREIVLLYRRNDQPVVDLSVPAGQDITDGVVQIVVTEARLGAVRVQGTRYFDPDVLLNQIYLTPGQPIFESTLLEEQRWLYRNPYRLVDLELSPGAVQGETDLIFNITDKKPIRFYGGYEDTGTQATGLERTFYGINWYNAFGRDDQFGYQYTASRDFNSAEAHSAFYSTALPNRDILTVYASLAEFDAPLPGFLFANKGSIWQVLFRWYRELYPIGRYEHGITAGLDYRHIGTGVVFQDVPVFESRAEVNNIMVGYHGNRSDCTGSFNVGADLYMSPGYWSGLNKDVDFETVRPGASASYFYTRAYFERRYWLPWHLEAMARITGQVSDGNLLPTEQLGLGGYNSVRGYDLYSIVQDSGYFANFELRTQPVSLGLGYRLGLCDEFGVSDDELTAHIFYDYGDGYDHTLLPGQPSRVNLQSVGCGIRYALQRRFSLRVDYGWQLNKLQVLGQLPQPEHRVHIGAVMSY